MSASSNSAEEADGLDVDSDAEADVAVQPPDELYDEQADDKVRASPQFARACSLLTPLTLLTASQDEAWATVVRQGRQSAAILSCPCCLETLCLDCQQCVHGPATACHCLLTRF